jgi:heme/copper-type cytochrome/quinol oxidase subunit 4
MNNMKKILLCIFSFLCGITIVSFPSKALAQSPTPDPSEGYIFKSCDCYAHALDLGSGVSSNFDGSTCKVKEGSIVSSEGLGYDNFQNMAFAMAGSIAGICTSKNPQVSAQTYGKSALGMTTNAMAGLMANPPASSSQYIAYVLQNAGLVEPAYAQGIGYSGLSPLIGLWRVFRNISYIILVIVLVAIGFMIMFRMNINPQTVISIQNALPGIIVTLVLITFSYAIAGLLIDLMYFFILLITSLFYQVMDPEHIGALSLAEQQEYFLNMNLKGLFSYFVNWENIVKMPTQIFSFTVPAASMATGTAGTLLYGLVFAVNPLVGMGLSAVITAIPLLIIAIALFASYLRIFMILLTSYIQILINVIFAPIILLGGAIPGNNAFVNWIKGLLGNLIVYPAVAGILLLANAIKMSLSKGSMWQPPFLFGGTASPDILVGLIGLGFMLLAPSLILKIKKAIAPEPVLPVSPGVITGPTTGVFGKAIGLATVYSQLGGTTLGSAIAKKLETPSGEGTTGITKAKQVATGSH